MMTSWIILIKKSEILYKPELGTLNLFPHHRVIMKGLTDGLNIIPFNLPPPPLPKAGERVAILGQSALLSSYCWRRVSHAGIYATGGTLLRIVWQHHHRSPCNAITWKV